MPVPGQGKPWFYLRIFWQCDFYDGIIVHTISRGKRGGHLIGQEQFLLSIV